jgi:transcriptional regulator with AAA-type ATPase domain
MSFSDLVETIKSLSIEEKQEIQLLLSQYLREERREEIYEHLKISQAEEQNGKLQFSNNINELKQLIED